MGTWKLTGKTLDATEINIQGHATFSWLPGKFFFQQDIELDFMGHLIILSRRTCVTRFVFYEHFGFNDH